MTDISLLVAKITFAVAELIFKGPVINSSVAEITFVVDEITSSDLSISFFHWLTSVC